MLNTIKKFEKLGYRISFIETAFYITREDNENYQHVGNMKEVERKYNELFESKSMRLN